MKTINKYKTRIDKLEPKLKKTVWPPISYMMIPFVLNATDKLLKELENEKHKSEEHMALHNRLHKLRTEFRKEKVSH